MNKNSIIGLIIIGAVLIGYSIYSSKQQEKYRKEQAEWLAAHPELTAPADTLATVAADSNAVATITADTLTPEQHRQIAEEALRSNLGDMLYAARNAEEQTLTLENDVMKISFSNRGAQVSGVELKDYMRYAEGERTEPIQLFKPGSADFDICMYIRNGANTMRLNTRDYAFTLEPVEQFDGYQQVTMRLPIQQNASIDFIYKVYNGESESRNYMVDFDVKLNGMSPLMNNQTQLAIEWSNISLQNEKGYKNENMSTTIAYRFPDEKSVKTLRAGETVEKSEKTKINWVAFKQHYFSSIFIADNNFDYAAMKFTTFPEGSGEMKDFSASLAVPYTPQTDNYAFQFYFGPNKYSILKDCVSNNDQPLYLEHIIQMGWFGWINRWFVIPLFDWLHKYIANFGVIILIMTILIKIIISPLTYKSYLSMAKMRVVKPEMDEINAKYPKQEDAMKKQQAIMDLYKRAGINPMGGCIPVLIQLPILYAMFRFFPASIELRGQSFLWADDLSSYDSILNLPFNIPWYGDHVSLFALLMALALFFYSWLNYQQNAQPQMAGMKFMSLYLMPILMLLWFNEYASGLCYYYLLSNLITIGQTYAIRALIDDDKIQRQIAANSAKSKKKKKSRLQQRYEELMKQQEEMRRQQQRKK